MKKKFTILATALMLVAFLIPPLAMRGQTWEAAELSELTSSDVFVIVSSHATNGTYAMSNDNGTGSAPSAVSVTVSGEALTGDIADNIKWNISGNDTDGYIFYPNGETETWLYCTATNNGVRVGTNDANTFKMEASSGYLVHQGTSRYIGIYNNQDWRCYTTINNNIKDQTFTFYKYVEGGTPTPTHELTFGANPAEGGSVTVGNLTSPATVAEGNTYSITAIPNTGYVFSNWTVTGEGSSVNEAGTTFTMGTADATLTANFTQVSTYTVTYYPNVVGTAPIEVEYNEGENVIVAANTFSNPGHAFTKWNTTEGGTGTDYMPNDVIENINADIDLYAQWEESDETVDVLNNAFIGVTGTSYSDWNDKTGTSGAVYAGNSAGGNNAIQLRSNNNNSGIVTTETGGLVSKVTVTWNNNTSAGRTLNVYGSFSPYEAASDLYNASTQGELLGTIVCGTSTMLIPTTNYTFIGLRSDNGAMYLDEIDITWIPDDNPSPVISIENNNELAYNATSGSFDVTITNPVSGVNPTVSEEVDWISDLAITGNAADGYSVTFNTTVNDSVSAREGTITLVYEYVRETIIRNVIITQAGAPYTTIPALFAAATSTAANVTVAFNDWVVSGVSSNGKNVFVTDGTNGFVIYSNSDMSSIYAASNVLSGTITCSLKLQNGFAQLTNVNAEDLTITDGGTLSFAEIAMANLEGVNTGALVQYENLTCSIDGNKYYLSDGTTTLQVYNSIYAFGSTLEADHVYNISGVYQQYNTTKEVLPRSADDIEEVTSTDPIIIANDVTIAYDATSGEIAYTIDNPVEGVSLQAATTADWISDITVTDENVTFTTTENEGTEDRTATITLTYTGAADKEVTVTQEHYVVDYATLPFSFDGGRADIETTDGLTQEGLGSDYGSSPKLKFDGTGDWVILKFNETPGTLTFDIKGNSFSGGTFTVQTSVDGVTYTDLETYTELGATQNESFDNLGENVRYIKWIYTEKVSGNVALGNIVLAKPNTDPFITLDPHMIAVEAGEDDDYIGITYGNMEINSAADFGVVFCDEDMNELSVAPDWIDAEVTTQTGVEGYFVYYMIAANTGDARNAYLKVYAVNEPTAADYVIFSQEGYVAPVPSITITPDNFELDAEQHVLQIPFTYENIEVTNYQSFTIHYYDSEGEEIQNQLVPGETWYVLGVTGTNDEGYQVSGMAMANEGEARSAYFKVSAQDADDNTVYSNLVTINQEAYVAPFEGATYTLATAIESGRHYIITNGTDKAMGEQNNNNRAAVDVTITEGVAQVESADVYEFVINGPDANGFYTIYDASVPGYLYAAGGTSSNYLKTQTFNNNKGQWTISFDAETNAASIVANAEGRNTMRYNSSSNIFSCYGSGQQDIYLYVKEEDVPQYDFYKDVAGYGTSDGGWYFIASPMTTAVDPVEVGMITPDDESGHTYDLYSWDNTQELEWINYRPNTFDLANGQGYLYANKNNTTLHFAGTEVNSGETSETVNLSFNASYEFGDINFMGNPFTKAAYVNRPFYVMNNTGDVIAAATDLERTAISPMEGFFVVTESTGETMIISTDAPANQIQNMTLNISSSNQLVDRAIVRFDNGSTLPKFQLNENSTKLYIPQGSKDYAIVRSAAQGEMPVNFKAESNGSYTLSITVENAEMEYLHLIDNMTGADVDLIANPSYTFDATTNDYASRFRLVFSTNNVNENETGSSFAYFNGSEWVVNTEATLQVVDLMGRVIISKDHANTLSTSGMPAGVYTLRLINGNDVKVQKIVVR